MQKHKGEWWGGPYVVALAALGLAGSAQAKLTGNSQIRPVPLPNLEVKKCIIATTKAAKSSSAQKGGPDQKPVVLQGGRLKQVEGLRGFFAATNGITLSKAPQNVPGGLLGIVPDASSPFLVKAADQILP